MPEPELQKFKIQLLLWAVLFIVSNAGIGLMTAFNIGSSVSEIKTQLKTYTDKTDAVYDKYEIVAMHAKYDFERQKAIYNEKTSNTN